MTPGQMRDAKPEDFLEAWAKVMHNSNPRAHAEDMLKAYPPPADMPDPTFYTPEDGKIIWHRARDITNPQAMREVKAYLYDRGIALPAEVSEAWARIMEHSQWAQEVRVLCEEAIARSSEEAVHQLDIIKAVTKALMGRAAELRGD